MMRATDRLQTAKHMLTTTLANIIALGDTQVASTLRTLYTPHLSQPIVAHMSIIMVLAMDNPMRNTLTTHTMGATSTTNTRSHEHY